MTTTRKDVEGSLASLEATINDVVAKYRSMVLVLRDLIERLDRDVPAHACPGFDCATCARPNTADARALLAKIEGW